MSPLLAGALAGLAALAALRAGWLTRPAAGAGGAVAMAHLAGGGWPAGLLLAVFVTSGSLLTRALDPEGPHASRRSARQVLANGTAASIGALLILGQPTVGWALLGGALATAQADTWATEVGRTSPTPPRDLWTGAVRPPGTSGAISWRGTAAGTVGALTLAAVAWPFVGWRLALAAAGGGLTGMMVDSALGGPAQTRYLCTVCGTMTEASRHCGARAQRASGVPGLGNSGVNAASTAAGALAAWLLSGWWS